MRFSLFDRADGVPPEEGASRVVYDVARGEAWYGATGVDGPALEWRLGGNGDGASLTVDVELDPALDWLVRCDRVDFPGGSVAHRHVHPGPGIRRLLHGGLTIERPGGTEVIAPGEAWFESAGDPVRAVAAETGETAFVRVLLLPREWAGLRTIRYVDPAEDDAPKLQRATVLLEEPVDDVA